MHYSAYVMKLHFINLFIPVVAVLLMLLIAAAGVGLRVGPGQRELKGGRNCLFIESVSSYVVPAQAT